MIVQPWEPWRPIFGGLDFATTTDLTAFGMVQRCEDQGWNANWLYWVPEARLDAGERQDHVAYRRWHEQGFLKVTKGARLDHRQVVDDVLAACVEHDIGEVAYDPFNAAWFERQLTNEGIETVKVRPGYADLSEASKTFEAAVADHTFRHGGNPVSTWCAENIEVESDRHQNIRPVKSSQGSKRIDGIVAIIMAMGVALVRDDSNESPYDTPGNLAL